MSSGFSLWKWASTTLRLRSTICSGVRVVVMVSLVASIRKMVYPSGGSGGFDAEVVAEDVLASELGGVAGEDDLTPAEDVGVVGDGQCLVHVLLDEEKRDVFAA